MNKLIYTLGDGYATGHIWPEWPQIMQALLPDYKVVNLAGIGAGAEFLVSQMVDHVTSNSYVVFQWPYPKRFDKLVDENWDKIIKSDPVYHFNIVNGWWLSSASTQPEVEHYHKFYINSTQHNKRLSVYQTLTKHMLKDLGCVYCDISTDSQEKFSQLDRFTHTRLNEIQPSPIVHLHYTLEVVLPGLEIIPNKDRVDVITSRIYQTDWIPYHPDRESMVADLQQ
jgi:hypothetical protein